MTATLTSSSLISVKNFDLFAGNATAGRKLLSDTHLKILPNKKYGLIGNNGCGKTTLLYHILNSFNGRVKNDTNDLPNDISVTHCAFDTIFQQNSAFMVEQEFNYDLSETVYNIVLSANEKLFALLKEKTVLENNCVNLDIDDSSDKLLNIYNQLELLECDKHDSQIKTILKGMGFCPNDFNKCANEFSGGWKMRINLARALYMKPQILLLDEPSNHLDLDATIWLINYLSNCYNRTIIVVSHDKNLLNSVCDNIILIEKLALNYFQGNYDNYEFSYQKLCEANANILIKKQRQLQALKKNNKMDKVERSKTITNLSKEITELKMPIRKPCKYNFATVSENYGEEIMRLENICFGYDAYSELFLNLNFQISCGQKIVIVGKNGVGKSTLLNIIMKNIKPTNGLIDTFKQLRIGYYAQHSHLSLDMNLSPVEYLMNCQYKENVVSLNEHDIRSKYNKNCTRDNATQTTQSAQSMGEFFCRKCLGDVGLPTNHHLQPIFNLSGGQKSRVAFARLFVEKPQLILLDEPTNHLDIETIDALVNSINEWNGTIIIITHNIHLIENTNAEIFEIVDRQIIKTTFSKYSQKIIDG